VHGLGYQCRVQGIEVKHLARSIMMKSVGFI
jgi:hypothetical protein